MCVHASAKNLSARLRSSPHSPERIYATIPPPPPREAIPDESLGAGRHEVT